MIYYLIGIVGLVFLDQLTKIQIENNFFIGDSLAIIQEFFHITYVQNRGIAFGIFQGKINLISVFTVIAIIGIIYYFIKTFKKSSFLEKLAYMLIISGAVGNMIDRIFRGYVVDMIDFRGIWSFVFNMADVYINIGVAVILLDMFIKAKKDLKEKK
ncbi:MAG: signal peptidase II [Fusobacterium perfoetens]|uniref:signal peptidase II n=1 Tax=Fusobacterium perfoetens TaxID=852 RepID=UPI0023F3191B|nr:signal peptidase II [Fusobacterium perfoetens]MCI6152909.1 signal peptidase II [Fusobacterium perfoetens]MDY3237321.1 signal peptidase II [Fusobacterium perfoetens]